LNFCVPLDPDSARVVVNGGFAFGIVEELGEFLVDLDHGKSGERLTPKHQTNPCFSSSTPFADSFK
jgi:hypothetical protein